jgi:hypothetical protein
MTGPQQCGNIRVGGFERPLSRSPQTAKSGPLDPTWRRANESRWSFARRPEVSSRGPRDLGQAEVLPSEGPDSSGKLESRCGSPQRDFLRIRLALSADLSYSVFGDSERGSRLARSRDRFEDQSALRYRNAHLGADGETCSLQPAAAQSKKRQGRRASAV